MNVLVLGTCRVHEPAKVMREKWGMVARTTGHRTYTLGEVFNLVQALTSRSVFDASTMHLMSDRSFRQFLSGAPPHSLRKLQVISRIWSTFDILLIEISSLKRFTVALEGKELAVSYFAKNWMEKHAQEVELAIAAGAIAPIRATNISTRRLKSIEVLEAMLKIKRLVGRPVLWVPHFNVPDTELRFQRVRQERSNLADVVSRSAAWLGDHYVSPSTIVEEMGRTAALGREGEDLSHYTPAAIERVAALYREKLMAVCAPTSDP